MNQTNEGSGEAHPVEHSGDEVPVDAVKSLGKIKSKTKALVDLWFQLLRLKE